MDIWNLIINIFVAVGTCGATWLALYPKKEKETLEGWYWLYDGEAIIHICNKGKSNVIFDEDVSLLFMRDKNDIAGQSIPLKKKLILPAGCSRDLRFILTDNEYLKYLKTLSGFSCCIYTNRGTIVRLSRGMSESVPLIVAEQEKYHDKSFYTSDNFTKPT